MSAILVGDVGATNCRFATWSEGGLHDIRIWPTASSATLSACVARYCDGAAQDFAAICVAVAGPVRDNEASLTNAGWSGAAHRLPQPARLINDLHAAARGVRHVGAEHLHHLGGPRPSGGDISVMGIGTGLGQALVVCDQVVPSEGGHTEFGPADSEQERLLAWLRPQLGRVTLESVVSGPGLGRILAFCRESFSLSTEAEAALATQPPGAVIFQHADRDPACAAALGLFLRCVGSAAGDMALRSLPAGGVVLCGGILPRIPDVAADGRLRAAFEEKPPMSHLLQALPLSLVTHPHLGLLGAAAEAERLLTA